MGRAKQPSGVGLGLRWEFLQDVLDAPSLDIDFFEVSPENYMRRGGWYPAALEQIAERYPILTHGLTLSLGGTEAPSREYLEALRTETRRVHTPWHSDHLCFGNVGGRVLHELLPLKFARENVARAADRLRAVQDFLGIPMAVENITWYAHPGRPEMSEAEFISGVLEQSDGKLLLDVNNVWVNSKNHGFDPRAMIAALPLERVVQIHVAGHTRIESGLILDTHGAAVIDPVIELLEWTLERTGPVPVLLERDHEIPALSELVKELGEIRGACARALSRRGELHASCA